jgi:outer membrane protein OmpA-like peptidoglycan-associated protein
MVRNLWRHGLVLAVAQLALTTGPAMSQSAPQQADSFNKDELVCALNPKCGADRVISRRKIMHRGITISQPESPRSTAAPPPYFNNITFNFDSAELTPDAQTMLDRIAVALRDPSNQKLEYRIEGHTDAKGSDAYNQALSQRRAESARNYLISMGIKEERLLAVGFGKTRLLPNPPAKSPNAPVNRRVQFSWIEAGH